MGYRTNIIVVIDGLREKNHLGSVEGWDRNEQFVVADAINDWLEKDDGYRLHPTSFPDPGGDWFDPVIMTGRINYFDVGTFITALHSVIPKNASPYLKIQLFYNTCSLFYTSVPIYPTPEVIEQRRVVS